MIMSILATLYHSWCNTKYLVKSGVGGCRSDSRKRSNNVMKCSSKNTVWLASQWLVYAPLTIHLKAIKHVSISGRSQSTHRLHCYKIPMTLAELLKLRKFAFAPLPPHTLRARKMQVVLEANAPRGRDQDVMFLKTNLCSILTLCVNLL